MEKRAALRVSQEQREIMLSFMKENRALATGRFAQPDGAKLKARLLTQLAEKLNSCGSGTTKSADKWLKSWQDWRCDTKQKAARIRRHSTGIGAGPPLKSTLTTLEDELLGFMGSLAVTGIPGAVDILDVTSLIQIEADLPVACPSDADLPADLPVDDGLEINDEQMQSVPLETVEVGPLGEPIITPLRVKAPLPSPTDSEFSATSSSTQRKRRRTLITGSEPVEEMKGSERILRATEMQVELANQRLILMERQAVAAERHASAAERHASAAEQQAAASRAMAEAVTATMGTMQECLRVLALKNLTERQAVAAEQHADVAKPHASAAEQQAAASKAMAEAVTATMGVMQEYLRVLASKI